MRKAFLAIAAAMMGIFFVGCNNGKEIEPDRDVANKIIGKWMTADRDGQASLTNKKSVYTFVSATKAYVSASYSARPGMGMHWYDRMEADVAISGNKVTVTTYPDEHTTVVEEYTVTSITANELTANRKITFTVNGAVVDSDEETFRFTKVTADYSAAILGTWQGHCTSAGSVFDDGQEHRWQYNADGNFVYYVKDGDNWVPSANTLNQYFVAGNLLCTRWVDNGEEHREWWEIAIDGSQMHWTALREDENGQRFTATFEMSKVN